VHIYPSVLQTLAGRGRTEHLEGGLQGYRGGAMQDLGYELRGIPIPRTWVNKSLAAGVFGAPSLTQESNNRSIRRPCYVVLGANGY
jgi:hypothetical protein